MYEMEGPRSVSLHRRTSSAEAISVGVRSRPRTAAGPRLRRDRFLDPPLPVEVAFDWVPLSVTWEVLLPRPGIAQGGYGASLGFIFRVNRVSTR